MVGNYGKLDEMHGMISESISMAELGLDLEILNTPEARGIKAKTVSLENIKELKVRGVDLSNHSQVIRGLKLLQKEQGISSRLKESFKSIARFRRSTMQDKGKQPQKLTRKE